MVVEPAWIGIGVLEVTAAPAAGVSVEVQAPDGWRTVLPGTPMRVTAGMAEVAIVGPRGRVETEVVIEADARSLFDPAPWLPTALTVRGVPAGAEVRLFLEGVEPPLERTMALDPHIGAVDGEWGIRVAPPVVLDGLVGGSGSLVLSHEELGLTAAELALEPGGDNSLELDWRDLEHSVEVRQRYKVWLDERAQVRRSASARVVTGASVGGAGVILSTVGWALAVQGSRDLNAARDGALAGGAHPDGAAGWQEAHAAALRQEGSGVALGVVGITLGAAGVVFAGAFGADGKVRLDRVGAWSPP